VVGQWVTGTPKSLPLFFMAHSTTLHNVLEAPAQLLLGSCRHLTFLLAITMLFPLFFIALLFSSVHAETVCKLSDPVTLDEDGLVTLEQAADKEEGTFTMRLTYYGGQSWIGIGINHDSTAKMTPSTAVIGRMLDGEPSVLKYDLESSSKDASGVIPMSLQTLQDATFTQTDTTSVLEFTQLLNEDTQVVSDDSVWIYAVGLPDNVWEGEFLSVEVGICKRNGNDISLI